MSDENATNDTVVQTDVTTNTEPTLLQKSAEPVPMVKADGSFIDGWHKHELLPEGVRGEKSLEVIKTLPDLVKRTINAERMVGKNKIAVPTEKSKPEEWNAFYEAAGRPKAADAYKMDIPDDFKAFISDDQLKADREAAFAAGASQKQFEVYERGKMEFVASLLKTADELEAKEKQEADTSLRKEFGGAYEERMHVANRLVAEAFGNDEEAKLEFLQEFGNHPKFIKFASIVGARMVESKALVAELTRNTPNEAQDKIRTLRATPGYSDLSGKLSPEERESINRQLRELYQELDKAKTAQN